MEQVTTELDLKESLVMLVLRVSQVSMGEQVQLERLVEGDLMAEEDHLDCLELLVGLVKGVRLESPVSQDLEGHRGQAQHQDPKERKETPDRGGLEEALAQLEKRGNVELVVARENQEIQDRKVSKGRWVQEENLEKTAEMGLELLDLKEEREMKASQVSQDLKEKLVDPEQKVDLAKVGTEDRGVFLETRVHLVNLERLDILGLMVRKVLEVLGLCNVTWLRRFVITALVAMVKKSALSTQRSLPLPWTHPKVWEQHSTTCARLSSTWSRASPSPKATVPEAPAWLWSCTTVRSPRRYDSRTT